VQIQKKETVYYAVGVRKSGPKKAAVKDESKLDGMGGKSKNNSVLHTIKPILTQTGGWKHIGETSAPKSSGRLSETRKLGFERHLSDRALKTQKEENNRRHETLVKTPKFLFVPVTERELLYRRTGFFGWLGIVLFFLSSMATTGKAVRAQSTVPIGGRIWIRLR